jgi:hypothetical protein
MKSPPTGQCLEETMFWSGRKAEACCQDVQDTREAERRRYKKVDSSPSQ